MAASLLQGQLNDKLRALELRLEVYRHDQVVDFQRYYRETLAGVDPAVAAHVQQAIALSFSDYPTLRPELELMLPESEASEAPASSGSAPFQPSPLPAVSGDAAAPSSPHEREKEFQGLFTPSYLPLLESSPISFPRLPHAAAPAAADFDVAPGTERLPEPVSPGSGAGQGAVDMDRPSDTGRSQGSTLTTPLPQRPGHVRRATDDTTSTGASDRSDTKPPRSALRRSSGSTKPPQSPRRVRFEFMGAEVLPTSSPQAAELLPDPFSPAVPSDTLVSDSILGVPEEEEKDDRPPPRKISSSDALRALSRTPLAEDTVWTVVNPDANEAASANRNPPSPIRIPSPRENTSPKPIAPKTASATEMSEARQQALGSVHEDTEPDVDDDDESSEEEFLAMGKPKSFATKQAIRSPVSASPTKATSLSREPEQRSTPRTTDVVKEQPFEDVKAEDEEGDDEEEEDDDDDDDAEDDELFHFETGGLTAPPKPRPRPPPKKERVERDPSVSPTDRQSTFATSPAMGIAMRPQPSSGPPTPTTARFQPGSLGSYKGRPVVMPIVRDPEVLAQAASLGQFNTFVGGLDGRSGMDEGDLNSFRASVVPPGFSGTPRSFTERYMMEEAAASRENARSEDKSR